MNITQKQHSQTSQSLFRLSLKNTRIFIKVNGNINQILTGPCNQKTTTHAGRDPIGCWMLQHPTVCPIAGRQSTKTIKQQNENENESDNDNEMNSTYNLKRHIWTDGRGQDD
jgi:hypothetical protein